MTLNDIEIVMDGDVVTADGPLKMTGDGDKLNITVGFITVVPEDMATTGPNPAKTESLKLMFSLDARSSVGDIMLPLDEGVVEIWVTMAPTSKPDMVAYGH